MPFSTYLCDPAPIEVRSPQRKQQNFHSNSSHPPSQQRDYSFGSRDKEYQSSDYGVGCNFYSGATPHYGTYYTRPVSFSTPLNSHNSNDLSGPSPSSSSCTTTVGCRANNSEGAGKPHAPSPSVNRASSDGLFQMPSFLMGSFSGTRAPGGGAEVLTPDALGMFGFVPSSFPPRPSPSTTAHVHNPVKPSWQSAKYLYTLEERHESSADDIAATPAPVSASMSSEGQASSPAPASPFGYLNAESPQDQAPKAYVLESGTLNKATGSCSTVVSPVEPTPTMAESDAFCPPAELYAPIPRSGLPVYSQSGFDMLSILARVARRPNPSITLGPVDLTCAFVVADVRRADAPIVYASRTFCELTGYSETEVLGRNCRFLQAPGGRIERNEPRRFTSTEAVRELCFALDKDREVQVSLINYRKDGRPFVNRVSVVPIPAEDGASEIAFHVGFQVDLGEQPGLIAQRIQDGKFYSGSAYGDMSHKMQTPAERSARSMGRKMRSLLSDPSFQSAVPLSTSCNSIPSSMGNGTSVSAPDSDMAGASRASLRSGSDGKPDSRDERQWLNLVLLEHAPDFVHVLSLKGHFLYVSPSITRSLGYTPSELIGKSVGDFCHPSDAVPLLRELKESTGQGCSPSPTEEPTSTVESGKEPEAQLKTRTSSGQRIVDLLFRMRRESGEFVWVESIGRLHIEAGKGRKAIVLSGRVCAMPNLHWGAISQAGGLLGPSADFPIHGTEPVTTEREFWAMLCEDGLFLVAGAGVRDLLGWGTAEMIGRSIREFLVDDNAGSNRVASVNQVITALSMAYRAEQATQTVTCQMKKRSGEVVWMYLTLYANESRLDSGCIIVQFKLSPPTNSSYAACAAEPPGYDQAYAFPAESPHLQSQTSHPYALNERSRTGKILHAPSTNVFAEFETHRGTSWQYELQQLKYANDKLRQDANILEARRRTRQQNQQQRQHQQRPHGPWVSGSRA